MKCDLCGRNNLNAQELAIHRKYFHQQKGQQPDVAMDGTCPDCGGMLQYQEGCVNCPGCGYSKCG